MLGRKSMLGGAKLSMKGLAEEGELGKKRKTALGRMTLKPMTGAKDGIFALVNSSKPSTADPGDRGSKQAPGTAEAGSRERRTSFAEPLPAPGTAPGGTRVRG